MSILNQMVNAGTLDLGGTILDWSLGTSYRNDTLLSADEVLAAQGGGDTIPVISSILDAAEEGGSVLFALAIFMLVSGTIAIGLVIVLLILVKNKLTKHKSVRPDFLDESDLSNISHIKGTEDINNQIYSEQCQKEGKLLIYGSEVLDISKDMPTTKQTENALIETVARPRRIITGPILSRSDVQRKPKAKVRLSVIIRK